MRDRIVLDQAWALEAIYAVFEREGGAYERIRAQRGRFTLADLTTTAWRGRGDDERALFLDMMRACGVCFRLDRHSGAKTRRRAISRRNCCPSARDVEADIRRDMGHRPADPRARLSLSPSCMTGSSAALIAEIGDIAGPEAVYWRDGVTVYETTTRARAPIEQTSQADCERRNHWCRRAAATRRICWRGSANASSKRSQRLGLEGQAEAAAPPAPPETKPMDFGRDPAERSRIYVSYAWADDDDPTREEKVDEICAEADKRGVKIIRDKDAMKRGDDISDFMQRLGKGDLVYVFLSDKYLKSPFCMFELFEIWRNSKQDEAEFKRRSAALCAAGREDLDAEGATQLYASYWDDELEKLKATLKGRDPDRLLGERDYEALPPHARVRASCRRHPRAVRGTLQPKTFEGFLEYGFEDLPK